MLTLYADAGMRKRKPLYVWEYETIFVFSHVKLVACLRTTYLPTKSFSHSPAFAQMITDQVTKFRSLLLRRRAEASSCLRHRWSTDAVVLSPLLFVKSWKVEVPVHWPFPLLLTGWQTYQLPSVPWFLPFLLLLTRVEQHFSVSLIFFLNVPFVDTQTFTGTSIHFHRNKHTSKAKRKKKIISMSSIFFVNTLRFHICIFASWKIIYFHCHIK